MNWPKSSKDRVIEFLQSRLAREGELLAATNARHAEEVQSLLQEIAEQAQMLKEAIALANELAAIPKAPNTPPVNPRPKTMLDRCHDLSARSYARATAKGRNLVAEMPPPGAHVPNAS